VLERGERYLQGRYNIALWHWELREFPAYWLDGFRYVNEVWVPTRFIQDCVAHVAPVPVVRIPLAAAAAPGDSAGLSRADLGLGEGQFVVLSVFDFHGVVERKNPFGLIEAFRRAFGEDDSAVMLLKCTNASYFPRERKALERAADGLNVRFLDEVMDRAHLNDLYSLSDCYLSLHRGEGFGLTITEAMLAGKPVIATGFGGNADFMCAENSYLVPYRLVEIPRDWFPYPKGGVWAEPDLDAAADLLRRVRQHPAEAATKGAQARATALREFAPERIGGLMEERLGAVARVLDFPGWPGEGQATGPAAAG
jgi:glycosyltransferase involved in cell wall biosynthesis